MSFLEVPGARIYHEVVGSGPLLLCISGGDGSVEIWRGFAQALKEHFTVVSWDRRGFSRSNFTGAQDTSRRLQRDADDAALLIEKYSPNEPATVIGNSSGAIVALQLLLLHSKLIRTLIPYEPPLMTVLPDKDELVKLQREIYDIYRKSGPFPAFVKFGEATKSGDQAWTHIDLSKPYLWSNIQYWFEGEFLGITKVDWDIEDDFRRFKDVLLPVRGEASPDDAQQVRAMELLCEKFGLEYVRLPGDHVGHATHAMEFGPKLLEALKKMDEFYAGL